MRHQVRDALAEGHARLDELVHVLDLQAREQRVRAAQPVDHDLHEMPRRTGVPVEELCHRGERDADQARLDRRASGRGARRAVEHGELAEERA